MRLENNEYSIGGNAIDGQTITIDKKALEKWRDHYLKVAEDKKQVAFYWGYYLGKADVLIDLLKHFEED